MKLLRSLNRRKAHSGAKGPRRDGAKRKANKVLTHFGTMKRQKRTRSSKHDVNVDRLSEMPDQVIVHILSFLPTRDAVRTMLLRRFGDLWTMLPSFSFDFYDHYVPSDYDVDDDDAFEEAHQLMGKAFSRFAHYVRNVLMLHRRPTIDSFHLHVGDYIGAYVDSSLVDDLQVWLKWATDRQVKHLNFACDHLEYLVPPLCVLTSQSLVTLELCGSMLKPYDHQSQLHMGSLRELTLIGVHGCDKAFNQLISACPSLQELTISQSQGLINLNITAPSVTSLELTDTYDVRDRPFTLNCPHLEILEISFHQFPLDSSLFEVNVIDVSSLQEVTVGGFPKSWSGPEVTAFLRHFRDVEEFTLSSVAFEQICSLNMVDIPQNRWLSLVLRPQWDHERCLQVITEFVRSSVDLVELAIGGGSSSVTAGDHEVLNSELPAACVIPRLTEVVFAGYRKGYEAHLRLVEFLLRNAAVLEKLVVTRAQNDELTVVEELELVKQVSKLKRASANAIVDFA